MTSKRTEAMDACRAVQSRLETLLATPCDEQHDIAILGVLAARYLEPGWYVDGRLYDAINRAAAEYGTSPQMAKLAALISGLSLALGDARLPQPQGIRVGRHWVTDARGRKRKDAVPLLDLDPEDFAAWVRRRARVLAETQLLGFDPNDLRAGRVSDPFVLGDVTSWDVEFPWPDEDADELVLAR